MKIFVLALLLVWPILAQVAPIPQVNVSSQDVDCLARNIYFEGRGETVEGRIAIAQVTLNRVKSGKFQKSICGVVYAHRQFSWTLQKSKTILDSVAWAKSRQLAHAILAKAIDLPHFPALYFHTKHIKPYWSHNKTVLAVIANHIFYS